MRRPRYQNVALHAILIVLASLTLTPFLFTANNIFRTKKEFDQSFFSFPDAFEGLIKVSALYLTGNDDEVEVVDGFGAKEIVSRDEAFGLYIDYAQQGPSKAWSVLRPCIHLHGYWRVPGWLFDGLHPFALSIYRQGDGVLEYSLDDDVSRRAYSRP